MDIIPVNAIRPEATITHKAREGAWGHDIAWMLDRKDTFIHVTCPACGGEDFSLRLEKDGFTFDRCAGCKTLYMPLRPSAELLAEFYAGSASMEYFSKVIFPASREARIEHIYKPRRDALLAKCSQAGRLGGTYAEIGAGSGLFASLVQESRAFARVLAVEPSAALAADGRTHGLEVLELPVEQLGGVRIDVVASFEVLEHIFSPVDFLRHVHRVLTPGGLCILTTPNGLGFDVLELELASTTVGFTHLTLFNPDSITNLLQEEGFRVLEVATPGKLDVSLVRGGWEAGTPPSSPFLAHVLREAPESVAVEFQKFICENLLSSHMWVVAQKL